jgi:hypothetical protein
VHPLDLVGKEVRRRHLHGGRQLENDLIIRRCTPLGGDRVADVAGELELGGGECLRAVFERPLGFRLRIGQLAHQAHRRHGHIDQLFLAQTEHDVAKRLRCRVVHVHDGPAHALKRVHGPADEVLARLCEDLDSDIARFRLPIAIVNAGVAWSSQPRSLYSGAPYFSEFAGGAGRDRTCCSQSTKRSR